MLELRTNANYDSTEVANIIVNYLPVELVNFYSEFKEKIEGYIPYLINDENNAINQV